MTSWHAALCTWLVSLWAGLIVSPASITSNDKHGVVVNISHRKDVGGDIVHLSWRLGNFLRTEHQPGSNSLPCWWRHTISHNIFSNCFAPILGECPNSQESKGSLGTGVTYGYSPS